MHRKLLLVFCAAILVAAPSFAQTFNFQGRFRDSLDRSLHTITDRGADVSITFRNPRTGETRSLAGRDGIFSSSEGDTGVSFSEGVSAGDTIVTTVSVGGSSPVTLVAPASTVITSQEATAGSASRQYVVGGPAAARGFVFNAQFVDRLGRSLHAVSDRGADVELRFRNTRTGEERVLAGRDSIFNNSDGGAAVTFSNGGNQSARVGDTIAVSVKLTGSATSTVSNPTSFVVTTGDISAGSSPRHRVFAGGDPGNRAHTVQIQLLDSLGRSLFQSTNRGEETTVTIRNLRSGEVHTLAGRDSIFNNSDGGLAMGFNEGGNQSVLLGDIFSVSVLLGGLAEASLSYPPTFAVTSGEIERGITDRRVFRLGGASTNRSLVFNAQFVDSLGRSLHLVSDRGADVSITFLNTRSGESHTLAGRDSIFNTSDGGAAVTFSERGVLSARIGDVVRVSVQLSGSLTSTVSHPESFVVTSGDLVAGATPRHLVVAGGAPSNRSLVANVQLVDSLGQSLHVVSDRGADITVTMRNLRTGERRTLAGRDAIFNSSDGGLAMTFQTGGHQSVRLGDVISVSVVQSGASTSSLSVPSSFVVTEGDLIGGATPRHRIVVGGPPASRALTFRTLWTDALGRSLHEVSDRGNAVRLVFRNTRTGEQVERAGRDAIFSSSAGNVDVGFTTGGAQAARAGDVIAIEAFVSGGSGSAAPKVGTFPEQVVLTREDVAQPSASAVYPVRLTSIPFNKAFTITGRVSTNNQSVTVTGRNDATGETETTQSSTNGDYSLGFGGTTSQPAVSQFEQFTVNGSSFIANEQNVRTGQRLGFNPGSTRKFVSFSGFITDALARPVPGATVNLFGIGTDAGVTRGLNADSAPGFYFFTLDLPSLGAGDLTMQIDAPGHPPFQQQFTTTQQEIDNNLVQRNFQLPTVAQRSLVVQGEVRESFGRVLDGTTVTVRSLATGEITTAFVPTSTAQPGQYSLTLARSTSAAVTLSDTLALEFSHPVLGSETRQVAVTNGNLQTGRLTADHRFNRPRQPRVILSGVVRDAFGRLLDGVNVRVSTLPASQGVPVLSAAVDTPADPDQHGTFTLVLDEQDATGITDRTRFRFDVVDPVLGRVTETTLTANGDPTLRTVLPLGTAFRQFRFPAVRHNRFEFEGVVLDTLGRPVDGATVTAVHVRTGKTISARTPGPGGTGRFQIVSQGAVTQEIQAGDRVRFEFNGPTTELSTQEVVATESAFNAEGGGAIRGLVLTLDDLPRDHLFTIGGQLFDAAFTGANDVVVTVRNVRTGQEASARTPTAGSNGGFPGTFHLAFGGPENDIARLGDTLLFLPVTRLGVTRPVQPPAVTLDRQAIISRQIAAVVRADFPPQARTFTLSGQILDAQGQPLDGVDVTASNPLAGATATERTPGGSTRGSFLFAFNDDRVGAASPSNSISISVGSTRTFDLLFTEAELRAGTAFRALRLGAQSGNPPALSQIAPASGARNALVRVTMTGAGFTGALGARLLAGSDSTLLTTFTVLSDTRAEGFVPTGLTTGAYQLFVFNAAGNSQPRAFTVVDPFAAPPQARIAAFGRDGGPPQVIELDGSRSSGESLSYVWSLSQSPAGAQPLAENSPRIAYDARVPGTYLFQLAIQDARGRTDTESSSFTIVAALPAVRIAGDAQIVLPDSGGRVPTSQTTDTAFLDGSSSFDPASQVQPSFLWSLLSAPQGSSVTAVFDTLSVTAPTLAIPLTTATDSGRLTDAGVYRVQLAVTGIGGTATATAQVNVLDPGNLAPSADAGLGQFVLVTPLGNGISPTIPDPTVAPPANLRPWIRLDGHESSDSSGRALTYQWRVVSSPVPVTLSGATTPLPTFAAAVAGDYVFGLVVSNGTYQSAEDQVTIQLQVQTSNTPPTADAVVRIDGRPAGARVPRATLDTVELDGRGSADVDDAAPLTYLWRQTSGRPVALVPGPTASNPEFLPPEPDDYAFELVVTDARGARSAPLPVQVRAISRLGTPPAVSVVASASTTPTTVPGFSLKRDLLPWLRSQFGQASDDLTFEDGFSSGPPTALKVAIPTTVTLAAYVDDPDTGEPLRQSHSVRWKQVLGPTVRLRPLDSPPAGAASAVAFEPTTSRVYVFRARITERDTSGETGVRVDRYVAVAVDGAVKVPVATFCLAESNRVRGIFSSEGPECPIPVVRAQVELTLDGTLSIDRNVPPRPLSFQWVQTAGPPVRLSNPNSSVTTFVVPLVNSGSSQNYAFSLFVDNGNDRSLPAPGGLMAVPSTGAPLTPGVNLVSVPLDPGTTGDAYDASDLLAAATGVAFVARLETDGRFRVYHPALEIAPFPIEGNRGYVLARRGPEEPFVPGGVQWPSATRRVTLRRGLNAIGYPSPVPSSTTAESLRALAGASFLAVTGANGQFIPYVPGISASFPISGGQGVMLVVPVEVTIDLP